MSERHYITRSDVMHHFLEKMPWPTPTELAPIAIYLHHKDYCPSDVGGNERACICEAVFAAKSERIPDWKLSVVLPRIGAEDLFEMPEIKGGH